MAATGSGRGASGRADFLRLAARVMRNLLVDHARQRNAAKRGGGVTAVSFDDTVRDYERACADGLYRHPEKRHNCAASAVNLTSSRSTARSVRSRGKARGRRKSLSSSSLLTSVSTTLRANRHLTVDHQTRMDRGAPCFFCANWQRCVRTVAAWRELNPCKHAFIVAAVARVEGGRRNMTTRSEVDGDPASAADLNVRHERPPRRSDVVARR